MNHATGQSSIGIIDWAFPSVGAVPGGIHQLSIWPKRGFTGAVCPKPFQGFIPITLFHRVLTLSFIHKLKEQVGDKRQT